MGIISEFAEVRANSNNVKYYESLGYEIPKKKASKSTRQHTGRDWAYDFSKIIMINIKDLPKGSPAMVNILCDMCKKNKMFVAYETYNRVVRETGNYVCQECSQKKMEDTMQKRHGVKRALQSKVFVDAFKNTCIDRYGKSFGQQFTDKAFEAFRNRTGYDYPAQSPEVQEKIIQSFIEHYGTRNGAQSSEVREKMSQTLYANSSQKVSKQQRYINNLYQGILNFPVKYYNIDICFPEEKLAVEYDGGFHDGQVKTGKITQEEFDHKELIRDKIIKSEGYKIMRIISLHDKLPSDTILLQMLSDARTYFQTTKHTWMTYDIDKSLLFNAENKNGAPYNFGALRTIKESDLQNQTTKKGA